MAETGFELRHDNALITIFSILPGYLKNKRNFSSTIQQCEGIRVNAVPQETEIGADITQSREITSREIGHYQPHQ